MIVSVIIPTKNRVNDLKECIESLISQTYGIEEFIIVDQSNGNETENYIRTLNGKDLKFNCNYIKQMKDGLASARNNGIDCAKGDIIVFADDDIIFDKNYIKEIVTIFANDKNKEIGGVGGKLEERKKESKFFDIFHHVFGMIFLRDSWKKGCVTISGHHARLPDKSSYVEWINGASQAYRKNVLAEFRVDEKLETLSPYAYYEDLDFSYRISRRYSLFLNSRAKAVHKGSTSLHPDFLKINSEKVQNHYYLIEKHKFNRVAFWWSTFGLLIVHVILLPIQPHKNNYLSLKGLIDGIQKIMNRRYRDSDQYNLLSYSDGTTFQKRKKDMDK
jgi:GT2 family glycosyltransferase